MVKEVAHVKRFFGYLVPALVILLGLAACTGQVSLPQETALVIAPTPTPQTSGRGIGDTLVILNWEAPTILNPHLPSAVKDWEASRVTYEPLASFDKDGNLVPFLASEIPSPENGGVAADYMSVTWKLKQGVKWSDGEPFTADDVVFTYDFIRNPDVQSASFPAYEAVKSVEAIDDHTVKVTFQQPTPYPSWALPFVGIQGMIIPRHTFKDFNGANARNAPANLIPVGTGPYRVVSFRPQEVIFLANQLIETNKIVYEPNPYFREPDKPFFSRVEMRGGGTIAEAARSVLKEGTVDYAYSLLLTAEELTKLEAAGRGRLVVNFGSTVERLLINQTDPKKETAGGETSSLEFPHRFFSDKRVRQAFAYAINRDKIAALYGKVGKPTSANLVAPPQYYSPDVFYEYNLDKAKALLDEAGWQDTNGDGFRDKNGEVMQVVFQATVGEAVQQTQEIIKEDLNAIGVKVELKPVDSSIMFSNDPSNPSNFWRFNADIQEAAYTSPSPDPGSFMKQWTQSQIPQQANNWSGLNIERWSSPEYDALYQQYTTELDSQKRQDLIIQMNNMLVEEVVLIPMVHLAQVSGAKKNVEGIDLTPWDAEVWNIKDWRRNLQ